MAYVGEVEDSEEEEVVEEGGCVDDDLLGCCIMSWPFPTAAVDGLGYGLVGGSLGPGFQRFLG